MNFQRLLRLSAGGAQLLKLSPQHRFFHASKFRAAVQSPLGKPVVEEIVGEKERSEVKKTQEEKNEAIEKESRSKVEKEPSFIKEIFTGEYNTDVLTYPEVIKTKEDFATLEEMYQTVESYFLENVDSKEIDASASIPSHILKGLKDLGLYGQQVPTHLGGLGLNATGYARLAEATSIDSSIAVTLAAHQAIGFKGLLLYGNEEQKKKYLPSLASGEVTAAFCLTEPSTGSDASSVKTTAKLSSDGSHWILNGSKLWISNGGTADFFTVFANTSGSSETKSHRNVTAFLVERQFGGVTNGKPEDKLGIRGSNTCEVYFDSTPVPVSNVLGSPGEGFKIAVNILNSGRLSMGSSGAGSLRRLLSLTTEHAVNRKQFGKNLSEFGLIKEKIARVTINAYVMESMAYLTAGLVDEKTYEDCAIESAIVKVFSSEAIYSGANECLQILGGMGYMKNYPYERGLRDARILLIFEGTNEILRLFIALGGLQAAGQKLREDVKKLRNVFQFPHFALGRAMTRWRDAKNNPKFKFNIKNYVHPGLNESANRLEYSILRLNYVIEIVLARHGTKVIEAQMELKRLADIAIDIYAMTAVIGRASRAYCTGIQYAGDEILIAETFSKEALERVKKNVQELLDGPFITSDDSLGRIANKVFERKGYFYEHPLVRNIW